MKTPPYILITALLLMTSCARILPAVYGLNNHKTFASKADYTKYITQATRVHNDHVLYVHKSDFHKLMSDISTRNVDYYYGTFINDSMQVEMSGYFKDNQSCGGRIIAELKQSSEKTKYIANSTLKEIRLYRMDDNSEFVFPNSNKRVIFLIHSYKMGSVHKKDYKHIAQYITSVDDLAELYVISIDPYDSYN